MMSLTKNGTTLQQLNLLNASSVEDFINTDTVGWAAGRVSGL